MQVHLLTVLLPVALCQIKPDVSFDDGNDRFDLTPLLQEGSYDQWGDVMDGVRRSSRLSRRNDDAQISDSKISDATSKFMEAVRSFRKKFGFKTPEGEESEDSEEKKQMRRDLVSYLHEQPQDMTRRSGRTQAEIDREVMMHHAVPIVMKVQGIMQMPGQE